MTPVTDIVAYLGMANVDNCFHRTRIRERLGQFFVLPRNFSVRELGLTRSIFAGRPLAADDRIRVCCAYLPMGLGWHLHFAQRINEQRMPEDTNVSTSTLINDEVKTVVFDVSRESLFHLVYVDNLCLLF